jgi:glucokinase
MLLAGDVGGTKTLLGLFAAGTERPRPVVVREYATTDFDTLVDIVDIFLDETRADAIEAVCVGAAGPVADLVARLTSAPFVADLGIVAERLGDCPAALLNDLEAMAWAVPVLEADELAVLQGGVRVSTGHAALIAAGTGLGEAFLHNMDGRFVPSATEAGHADFAARTHREAAFVEHFTPVYGRVDVERVLSGPGLVNLFRFTHGSDHPRRVCPGVALDVEVSELPAEISASALGRRCDRCVEALEMFVEAYGAESGNLALRTMGSAGIYLGGGIAPKILPALRKGSFMDAFLAKDPMTDFLRTIPVMVILNPQAALVGAAVRAAHLAALTHV